MPKPIDFLLCRRPWGQILIIHYRVGQALDIEVRIWKIPVKIPTPLQPFDENEKQASYDPEAVGRIGIALL